MLAIKAIDVVVVELLSSFFRGEMYDGKTDVGICR